MGIADTPQVEAELVHVGDYRPGRDDRLMAEHARPSCRQISEALLDRRAVVVLALLRRVQAAADVLELAKHLRNLVRAAREEPSERGVGELVGRLLRLPGPE